jgi:diguanylate cyclase
MYIGIYAFRHRKTPGGFSLFLLSSVGTFWSITSLLEAAAQPLEVMLLWRNLQQISTFSIPIVMILFTIELTEQPNLKKYLTAASIIPLTALILIFTNDYHHLMRSHYSIESSPLFGDTLIVHSTLLGMALVSFNFIFPIFGIIILAAYRKRVSQASQKQITLIIISFLLTLLLTWMKVAFLELLRFHVPISVLYSPSIVILFYAIFKYNFFSLAPIAKDTVFKVVKQGIMVVNREGIIVDVNDYAIQLLKLLQLPQNSTSISENPLKKEVQEVFSVWPWVSERLETEKSIELAVEPDGNERYIKLQSYPLFRNGDEFVGNVFMIQDITETKLLELELRTKSETDELTGLKNRRSFQLNYDIQLNLAIKNQSSLSLLMLDLDRFKLVNDNYGHSTGDRVLRECAGILRETVRGEEIIARLGGEEFGILLPGVNREQAFVIAERIRNKIKVTPVQLDDGNTLHYTVSIGITESDQHNKNFDAMLSEADTALYQAKNLSRDCTVIFRNSEPS